MLVIRYISVNQKLTAIKEETETISTQMLKDNERLNQFILTKFILGEILTLRSKQFDYSAYLEQAQAYIPAGSEISGVDFQTVGFVNIRVMSRSSNQVALLEKSLKDAGDKAPKDIKENVEKKIKELKNLIGKGTKDEMEQKTKDLSDELAKIGQAMYNKQTPPQPGQEVPKEEKKSSSAKASEDKGKVEEGQVVN